MKKYDEKEAKYVLELMFDSYYNADRPSVVVIEDLIDIVIYLNKRISKLEEEKKNDRP